MRPRKAACKAEAKKIEPLQRLRLICPRAPQGLRQGLRRHHIDLIQLQDICGFELLIMYFWQWNF